jgi:hypothetical protein
MAKVINVSQMGLRSCVALFRERSQFLNGSDKVFISKCSLC